MSNDMQKCAFGTYLDSEGPGQPAHMQSDLGIHCPLMRQIISVSVISLG